MATTQEPEGIVELGRQVAEDAANLVRAEISLAKAHAFDALKKFAAGIGLIIAGLIFGLFFMVFTIGTLVEGRDAIDSWPLYVALGGLLIGVPLVGMGMTLRSWLRVPIKGIGFLGLLLAVVGMVWFYVIAIIGDGAAGTGFEIARRGWAIAGAAFFGLTFVPLGIGAWVVWRGVGGTMDAVDDIKEDAAWVKQLTKRNASES